MAFTRHGVSNRELNHAEIVESNSGAVLANMTKCPASGMKTVLLSLDPLKFDSSSSSPWRVQTKVSLLPKTIRIGTLICEA